MNKEDFLFPYENIRNAQDNFIKIVDKAVKYKKHVLAHVPTGVGKTAGVLGPTLKYAIKNNKTVFFLTPRHTQHHIAVETLKEIKDKYKIDFKAVDFIGKKWMCPVSGTDLLGSHEFAEYCKEVKDKEICEFYQNIQNGSKILQKQLLLDELKEKPRHVQEVCEACEDKKFCSYEISTEIGKKANVIIGDYYHMLSPSIRDSLFKKMNKELSQSIIIFDEAHNLPSKCRDLLTNNLSTFNLDGAINEARQFNQELEPIFKEIKEIILNFSKNIPLQKNEGLIERQEFFDEVERIDAYEKLIVEFKSIADAVREEKKRSYIGGVAHFLEAWTGPDEGFARILTRGFSKNNKPFTSLGYRCLDPSFLTKPIIENAHSVICMSGTLWPIDMYDDLLGFDDVIKVDYENPFPSENRLNLIVPKTSTKFTMRSEKMYKEIAENINKVVEAINGNVAVFFPSYKLRDDIFVFLHGLTKRNIINELPELNKNDREKLIEKFKSFKEEGAILLGVSGGSFGEGIDLPGNLLKGVIVVGLPLGKPDLETEQLIRYYDIKFAKGMDYGYFFPAFIKTFQNAGRCIRSETDMGVVVFLDQRYAWSHYLKYFPEGFNCKIVDNVDLIYEFMKNN
ncbi:MAG: ATP-dependent DNA helicase [Nanoarchaeota archaeon]|nr:ATP-dependent DNA helicase [Nanoarchaeota archaeon]MBU1445520.1 ATP-dependent DNA helicase [Nanoarchaeota archaeon]MBU2420619.1 ATP-dependent DNA helicase [Nanoarchaeota archaeon]MBU2474933.1 ATP-dependent DNA helicase [Nanoarchaeota archaeon]